MVDFFTASSWEKDTIFGWDRKFFSPSVLKDNTAPIGWRKNYPWYMVHFKLFLGIKLFCFQDKHSDNIFLRRIRVVPMSWNFTRCWNYKILSWQTQLASWCPNFPHQMLWKTLLKMNGHRNLIVRLSKVTQGYTGQMHCAIKIGKIFDIQVNIYEIIIKIFHIRHNLIWNSFSICP